MIGKPTLDFDLSWVVTANMNVFALIRCRISKKLRLYGQNKMKIFLLTALLVVKLFLLFPLSNMIAYTFSLSCSYLNVQFDFLCIIVSLTYRSLFNWTNQLKCIFLLRHNITSPCQTLLHQRFLHFVVLTILKYNFVTYSKIYDSNMMTMM